MISGVPQGSVLGPLIFLILIGDIADDTRITNGVKNVTDASNLQTDLESVYEWVETNNMRFNESEFEILRYYQDCSIKLCKSYLSNAFTIIDEKEEVRDLGVIMSNSFTFQAQINNIIEKGKYTAAWILRTFKSRSKNVMITLWKSLAIPKIVYCSQLWFPLKIGDIQRIEIIQWSYIRKSNGCYGLNYWEVLKELNLYSLQRRRERYRCGESLRIWYQIFMVKTVLELKYVTLQGLEDILQSQYLIGNVLLPSRQCIILHSQYMEQGSSTNFQSQ